MAEISAIFCFFYCRFNLKFVIFSGDFLLIFVCTKPHPARGEFFTVNLFLSPRILPAATGGNSQGFLFSGGWGGGIMLLHSPIHYGPPRWKMFWGIVGLFCIQKNFELFLRLFTPPPRRKWSPSRSPEKKSPRIEVVILCPPHRYRRRSKSYLRSCHVYSYHTAQMKIYYEKCFLSL